MPLALGGVAVLVAVVAITVRIVAADAAGCAGGIPVRAVATPEIAPVIQRAAASWTTTKPRVNGECVELTVDSVPSPTVAGRLTAYAGRAIDVAADPEPTPNQDELPDIWIPDSTAWLTRVQAVDRSAFEPAPRSIASSPVVLAMPESAAKLVGWPAQRLTIAALKPLLAKGGTVKLGIAEPRRESSSLAAAMMLGEAMATSDAELPALVSTFRTVVHTSSTAELLRTFGPEVNAGPASEQAVLAYNATNPEIKLVGVQIDPVAPILDYPFAVRFDLPRDVAQAADLFRARLLDRSTQEPLARQGFRSPDGEVGSGFPASAGSARASYPGTAITDRQKIEYTLGLWAAANSPSRTLAMFDVTSSMAQVMQTSTGPKTRAQVMVEAARRGLELFTGDSRVGMWTFADQHREVLPIDVLSPERKAEFGALLAGAVPGPTDASPLYDTLLAAYKAMKEGYDPERPNIIVVLTDGGDSNAGGVRLEKFKLDLQQVAEADKPIRVVLIGIDATEADATDLRLIAEAVGGAYFPLTSPEQIQAIFLKALLRVGAA